MTIRRVVALALAAIVLTPPSVALADAAAPTDYRTEIIDVHPQVDGLEVAIEGGDSFIWLQAPPGATVVVFGYAGEPYLQFEPDGTVSTNRLSSATYENATRYGNVEVPAFVDYSAAPIWDQVASNGSYAWHDHRSHWMAEEPPVGLEPGDSIPAQVISLIVDGRAVEIVVETTLIASPSLWPAALGLLVGLQLALLGWWLGPATATFTIGLISLAALLTGGGQYLSLPSETGPLMTWWLMPAIALLCGAVSIATYGRSDLAARGLLAVSGLMLAIWAMLRWSALTHPVLPTDLPFWFDRATTAAAGIGGTIAAVFVVQGLVRQAIDPALDPASVD